jgi:hypothetical protein
MNKYVYANINTLIFYRISKFVSTQHFNYLFLDIVKYPGSIASSFHKLEDEDFQSSGTKDYK